MSKLDDTFKAVGVHSARDKILALCNAPTLFFNCNVAGEDHCMTQWATFVVAGILGEHIAKNDIRFQNHIREGLFSGPIDERRNLIYGLADPKFLDEYISAISEAYSKLKELDKEYATKAKELMEKETGVPLFTLTKDYREYHARKGVSANN